MTNLDSILKSRDITLPTKVRLVKAIVFPVVMYGFDSWLYPWSTLLFVPRNSSKNLRTEEVTYLIVPRFTAFKNPVLASKKQNSSQMWAFHSQIHHHNLTKLMIRISLNYTSAQ